MNLHYFYWKTLTAFFDFENKNSPKKAHFGRLWLILILSVNSDVVANVSGGIQELGQIQYILALCLLFCWAIVFLALVKGVQSLGND